MASGFGVVPQTPSAHCPLGYMRKSSVENKANHDDEITGFS